MSDGVDVCVTTGTLPEGGILGNRLTQRTSIVFFFPDGRLQLRLTKREKAKRCKQHARTEVGRRVLRANSPRQPA
jgi:hypothetical protein